MKGWGGTVRRGGRRLDIARATNENICVFALGGHRRVIPPPSPEKSIQITNVAETASTPRFLPSVHCIVQVNIIAWDYHANGFGHFPFYRCHIKEEDLT